MYVRLPVHKGAPRFLNAIDNFQSPTFSHCELFSDHGSTDDAAKNCQEFAGRRPSSTLPQDILKATTP